MKKQLGLAAIPLIFGLLIIIALPLTLKSLKENQNLQNRAASTTCLTQGQQNCFQTPCCQNQNLVCDQGTCVSSNKAAKTDPSPTPVKPSPSGIIATSTPSTSQKFPCTELKKLIYVYCRNLNTTENAPQGYVNCSHIINLSNQYCQN